LKYLGNREKAGFSKTGVSCRRLEKAGLSKNGGELPTAGKCDDAYCDFSGQENTKPDIAHRQANRSMCDIQGDMLTCCYYLCNRLNHLEKPMVPSEDFGTSKSMRVIHFVSGFHHF